MNSHQRTTRDLVFRALFWGGLACLFVGAAVSHGGRDLTADAIALAGVALLAVAFQRG